MNVRSFNRKYHGEWMIKKVLKDKQLGRCYEFINVCQSQVIYYLYPNLGKYRPESIIMSFKVSREIFNDVMLVMDFLRERHKKDELL